MRIDFVVPGRPVGKARPRVTRFGTYNTKTTQEYTARVQSCYKEQAAGSMAPEHTPVFAEIHCYFGMPKSWSKKKKAAMLGQYCLTKPDCDNVEKIVYDALNGLAYPDDSAIQSRGTIKTYTNAAPRVEVTFEWEELE